MAIAAAFFPTGLIVFALVVSAEPFILRAVCFALGAIAMTFGVGIAVVALAHDANAAGTPDAHVLSGEIDVALGVMLIVGYFVLRRRPPSMRAGRVTQNRYVQRLTRSPGLAFVLGAAMYAPSPMCLAALKSVADAGLSPAADLLWVALLTLIVTSFVDIPVVLMLRAPERGRARLAALNGWMGRNGKTVGMWTLLFAGVYLLARGVTRIA